MNRIGNWIVYFFKEKVTIKYFKTVRSSDPSQHPSLPLTLFRMGFFGAAHGWWGWGGGKVPLPKFCHTYPTMMKLDTVIPYPKKIQKIYESRDTPLEFC